MAECLQAFRRGDDSTDDFVGALLTAFVVQKFLGE